MTSPHTYSMAGVSGTPYSMEGGHSSSSFSDATDDVDRDMTGGFFSSDQTRRARANNRVETRPQSFVLDWKS